MSLKNIGLRDTYWSSEQNLIQDFYIPCLQESKEYCRAVGYFNSAILTYISKGLYSLIRNNGTMRIICSTRLTDEDQRKINLGYDIREIIMRNTSLVVDEIIKENSDELKNLCWLIKNGKLDIKVCYKIGLDNKNELFHEKFGVFKDNDNNIVSFLGSVNETLGGWLNNEESFEVSMNWIDGLQRRVNEKVIRFHRLWEGTAHKVKTYDFPDAVKEKLIRYAPEMPIDNINTYYPPNYINNKFIPRECQIRAKDKFQENNYVCLFMMATGTGKSKAALYSMYNVGYWKVLMIIVPSIELVEQWEKDTNLFYESYYVIKCCSNYPMWKSQILTLMQAKIPKKVIIISTYDTAITDYAMDKWSEIPKDQFAVIFDEAHNMGAKSTQRIMDLQPEYKIGLSATPKRNFDEEGSQKILDYFNNTLYEFTISDAIQKEYLVNYEYMIWPCKLSDESWNNYLEITKKINKLHNTKDEDFYKSKLDFWYRERANIIKTTDDKINKLREIFELLPEGSRILIYGETMEQLSFIQNELDNMNKYYFVYTGEKDSKYVRPVMLDEFKLGIRKILLAIGCLDEGIDIPVCDAAIFISSSTSDRQFIQRRGRVLRASPTKNRAYIIDFIVYPQLSTNSDSNEIKVARNLIESQYRRINDIARDAINGSSERLKLDSFLSNVGLNPYNY